MAALGDSPAKLPAGSRPRASCDLRRMFDDLTHEPLPKGLVDLCDQLEDAFRRGELQRGPSARRG